MLVRLGYVRHILLVRQIRLAFFNCDGDPVLLCWLGKVGKLIFVICGNPAISCWLGKIDKLVHLYLRQPCHIVLVRLVRFFLSEATQQYCVG